MAKICQYTLLALLLLSAADWCAPQIVKEKIEVVNIEVPVRVYLEGEALGTLKKSDFQLYEGGERQEINGFSRRRKKMGLQQIVFQANQGGPAPGERYFVLVFRIFEYNKQMQEGMDYFFSNMLRDEDSLLILVNDRTLTLNQDVWQIKRRQILEQILHEEAIKARQGLDAYFQRVSQNINQNTLRQIIENKSTFNFPQIINFLQGYLEAWREFKKKYLVPDLDKFYNFARHLGKIAAEKWVLNFYQVEVFPKIKIGGQMRRQIDDLVIEMQSQGSAATQFGRVINRMLDTLQREMSVANEFPAEQIGKMLTGTNTTYHCLISGVQREGLSDDYEYKEVANDLETTLREIASRSGGEVFSNGDFSSALHTIANKEDVYYVLTYAPKDAQRRGNIAIKVADRRLRLLYDDNLRSDYIAQYVQKMKLADPTVQLQGLTFQGGKIHFEISDFRLPEKGSKEKAQLNVVVRIRSGDNVLLYDQARPIHPKEKNVAIDIGFAWLKPGRYFFLIEAHDVLSGRTAMDVLAVEK